MVGTRYLHDGSINELDGLPYPPDSVICQLLSHNAHELVKVDWFWNIAPKPRTTIPN